MIACLSYLVASARHCLLTLKERSTTFRHLQSSVSGVGGRPPVEASVLAVSDLVVAFGDDDLDPAGGQLQPVVAGAVGLVREQRVGPGAGPSGAWSGDPEPVEQVGQHRGIPGLPWSDQDGQRAPGAVDELVDLGRQPAAGSGTSPVVGAVFASLGALLLVIGVRNWRNRADTSEPAVLASIAGMGPAAVAFLTLGATWVNPKNLVLLLSAGQQVGSTDRPWLWGAVFLIVATAPYTLASGYSLFGGPAAQQRLDGLRTWLVARNRLIMGIICTVLGLLLLVRGLTALLG
jgi:threonine/homoserine/homoserine lactone efflux protein